MSDITRLKLDANTITIAMYGSSFVVKLNGHRVETVTLKSASNSEPSISRDKYDDEV